MTSFALAAEPARSGLAVGGGVSTSFASSEVSAPSAKAGVRLVLGGAALLDLSAGGSRYRTDSVYSFQDPTDEGDLSYTSYDREELAGWTLDASMRLALRVGGEDTLAWYAGAAGAVSVARGSGPWWDDVEDENGVGTPTEVGTIEVNELRWSAGPSLQAVHPLTERLGISGIVDVYVVESARKVEQTTRTDADTPFVDNESRDTGTSLGFMPVVGIYLHLRV